MSRGLYLAYNNAGSDYLAMKLGLIFTKIENEEDKVRHNDMVSDVLQIVSGKQENFLNGIGLKPRARLYTWE